MTSSHQGSQGSRDFRPDVQGLRAIICGRQECPPVVGNVLVYLDTRHLTQSYAKTLTPYLGERLLTASSRVRDAG
jgi:hypothetical protein